MKKLLNAFDTYRDRISEQIFSHEREYALSEEIKGLWMKVPDSGDISFEVGTDYPGNDIIGDDSILLYQSGGSERGFWNLLPEFEFLLESEELEQLKDEVADSLGCESRNIVKKDIQEYYENNYPDILKEWIDEYINESYLDNSLEEYLDNLREKIECEIEEIEEE